EPQLASRLKNLSIPASVAVKPMPNLSAIQGVSSRWSMCASFHWRDSQRGGDISRSVTFRALPTLILGAVTMTTGTSSAVVLENAELSDAEVIQQVLDGNTALLGLLLRCYNERVYRAARTIVRDD